MGSFKTAAVRLPVVALGILIAVVPCTAQSDDGTRVILEGHARTMAADLSFGALPRGDYGPISFTVYPAVYRQLHYRRLRQSRRFFLPLVGLQWWVSPNLSIIGGLGSGLADGYVIQFTRMGLRYLPQTLAIGRFTPEFVFTRSRIDGLNGMAGETTPVDSLGSPIESTFPENAYWSKWNEYAWSWAGPLGGLEVAVGFMLVSQRTFMADGTRLEKDTTFLTLSAARQVFSRLRVSARLLVYSPLALNVHPGEWILSLGAQVSAAL